MFSGCKYLLPLTPNLNSGAGTGSTARGTKSFVCTLFLFREHGRFVLFNFIGV